MSLLAQLQAHTPELLLLAAWLIKDRRVCLSALLLALAVTVLRVFPHDALPAWSTTTTLGGWAMADRMSALFQALLCWTGLAVVWQGHQHWRAVVATVLASMVAVVSMNMALTIAAIAAAIHFATSSLASEERPSPPRVSLLVFGFGAVVLAVACSSLSYRGLAIGMSNEWLEETASRALAAWTLLAVGLIAVGHWALRHAAAIDANPQQRLFVLAAVPIALFAVWLRLSTTLFSGVVEGSVLQPNQGLMGLVQALMVIAALLFLVRSFRASRTAEDWLGQLAAAVPLHVALWLLAVLALNQLAITHAAYAVLIFGISAVALARPAADASRWLRLSWLILVLSWIGMPPTAGFHQRWLLAQSLLSQDQVALAVIGVVITLLLMIRLLPAALDPRNHSETPSQQLFPVGAAALLVVGFLSLRYLASLEGVGRDAIFW